MIDRVYKILTQFGYPVRYITRPPFDPKKPSPSVALSYHFFNTSAAYYGDGKRHGFIKNLQVDMFYTGYPGDLELMIIEKLEDNGFRFESCGDFDGSLNGVRLYHTVLRFNYLEREVE